MNIVNKVTPSKATWKVAGAVVLGLGLFGGLIYLIRRAPDNAITTPLKKGADIATMKG